MGYNLLIDGLYGGCNPITNYLLTSWDIQVVSNLAFTINHGKAIWKGSNPT